MPLLLVAAVAAVAAATPLFDADASRPSPDFRLVELSEGHAVWLHPDEITRLAARKVGFADITDHRVPHGPQRRFALPPAPQQQQLVRDLNARISVDNIFGTMGQLEAFYNRYYSTATGYEAVVLVEALFQNITATYGRENDVEISLFQHTWLQPSILVRLQGALDETVIVSSHIDTHSLNDRSPGADDNASGVANALEAFRVLLEAGVRPTRSLEFHVYAAEEVGLRGSADVAAAYAEAGVPVVSVINVDMSGYSAPDRRLGLIQDNTDPDANRLVTQLVDEYLEIGYVESRCGYGCSDHASWNREGYSSVFPFETPFEGNQFNPFYHSPQDTSANCDRRHPPEFVKLSIAFLVEISSFVNEA